jgi:hypothetical protein
VTLVPSLKPKIPEPGFFLDFGSGDLVDKVMPVCVASELKPHAKFGVQCQKNFPEVFTDDQCRTRYMTREV